MRSGISQLRDGGKRRYMGAAGTIA